MKAQIGPFREQMVTDHTTIGDSGFNQIKRGEIAAQLWRWREEPHLHFAVLRHRSYPDIDGTFLSNI